MLLSQQGSVVFRLRHSMRPRALLYVVVLDYIQHYYIYYTRCLGFLMAFGRLGARLARRGGARGASSVVDASDVRSFDNTARAALDNIPSSRMSLSHDATAARMLGQGVTGRSSATRGLTPRSSGGVPRGGYRL